MNFYNDNVVGKNSALRNVDGFNAINGISGLLSNVIKKIHSHKYIDTN